jgi:DNA-binding MarR family transcriptional regulator
MTLFDMPGHLIRRLNQRSTQIFTQRMQAAGFDLTSVQFAALDAVYTTPGLDQASIAAMIAYDRAPIGGVIDRLEQKGLVERSISRRDRRAREVKLSSFGLRVYEEVRPIVVRLQTEILDGLSVEEQEQFLHLAGKAVRAASTTMSDTAK